MKNTAFAVAGLGAIAALGCASAALAQAKAPAKPAPAAAPVPATPAAALITANIPGICFVSRETIVGASTVGKWVQTRLGQLNNQANAELSGEGATLNNDAKALEAKKTSLQPAQYQQQFGALQQRAQALQEKAQQRDREVQATEQKAVSRVLQEAGPLIEEAVKQKACAILLDGPAVLAGNPTMNLTPSVVQALNAKVTQFDFEREHLDTPAAAPR